MPRKTLNLVEMGRGLAFCLLVTLSFTGQPLNAQWIVAGSWSPSDVYFNFQPDSFVTSPDLINTSADSFFLDMNSDGISDLKFIALKGNGYLWSQYNYCSVFPLNGAQVVFDHSDSCISNTYPPISPPPVFMFAMPMARDFVSGDTIRSSDTWVNSAMMMNYHRHDVANPPPFGFWCTAATFTSIPRYLGVRIPAGNDTLYGWVKFYGVGDYYFYVDDYAIQEVSGQTPQDSSLPFNVFPNPTTGLLQVCGTGTLNVYDLMGKHILSRYLVEPVLELNIGYLPSGFYFFRLANSAEVKHFKIRLIHTWR